MTDKLYGLKQFNAFDGTSFFKDKELTVTGISEWTDFNTKSHLGTKVEVVITKDNTAYRQYKANEKSSNLYKRLDLKVAKDDLDVSVGDVICPVNMEISAYGRDTNGQLTNQRVNYLSIKCDDIEIVATA